MDSELVSAIIGVAGALVGAVVGVWAGVVAQQRSNRARIAFDLHAEFNNAEFTHARPRAAKLLSQHPTATFMNITAASPEDAPHAWLVVRFYEKLWVSIKYRHIDMKLVPDLFGSIFFWWYHNHLKAKLVPAGYESSRHIADLKRWFDNNVPLITRQTWEAEALRDGDRDPTPEGQDQPSNAGQMILEGIHIVAEKPHGSSAPSSASLEQV